MARDDVTTLTITVTKTSDGLRDYVQIMSGDMFTTNVVLIADRITVDDHRTNPPKRIIVEDLSKKKTAKKKTRKKK